MRAKWVAAKIVGRMLCATILRRPGGAAAVFNAEHLCVVCGTISRAVARGVLHDRHDPFAPLKDPREL
jgi:hypothetical protein